MTSPELLTALLRGTLLLSVAALIVWALGGLLKVRSANTTWRAWFAVLVCGLGIAPVTLTLPWLPGEERPPEVAREPRRVTPPVTIELRGAPPIEVPETMEPAPIEPAPIAAEVEPPAPTPTIIDSPPAAASEWTWSGVALAIWLVGLVAILLRGCWRYVRFLRSARACVIAPEEWSSVWRELLAGANVKRDVPMLVGESYGPALARLPRGYALIVPRGLWTQLAPEVREVILRHELAHYTRRDLVWSLVARWLAAPHWFNPLAHLAVRKLDEASEWACDDAATSGDTARQIALSKTLLGLSEGADAPGALQAAVRGRGLAVRIRRILETSNAKDHVMRRLGLTGVLAMVLVSGVVRVQLVAVAQDATSPKSGSPNTKRNAEANRVEHDDGRSASTQIEKLLARASAIKSGAFDYVATSKIIRRDEHKSSMRYAFDRHGWTLRINRPEDSWEQFPDGTVWYMNRDGRVWELRNFPENSSPSLTLELASRSQRMGANQEPPTRSGTLPYESMLNFVRKHATKVVQIGQQVVDGHLCDVLEFPVAAEDFAQAFCVFNDTLRPGGSLRLYCSPKLGFALPLVECRDRFGTPQFVYSSSDFQEAGNGLHFPRKSKRESGTYRLEYDILDVTYVNEALPADAFQPEIPAATHFSDARPHAGDPGNGLVTLEGYPFRQFTTGVAYPDGFPDAMLHELDRGLVEEPAELK